MSARSATQWIGEGANGHAASAAVGSVLGHRLLRRMGTAWCHHFHRSHHAVSGVDSLRAKVHCERCGRKFLLERRVG